jgi:hypothetical protein
MLESGPGTSLKGKASIMQAVALNSGSSDATRMNNQTILIRCLMLLMAQTQCLPLSVLYKYLYILNPKSCFQATADTCRYYCMSLADHSTSQYPAPAMTFRIPWRLLIPPGSVDTVIGTDGGLSLAQKSGAKVTVSTSEEAPVTLSDKIVKIEGSVGEQEEVLGHIVAELF